MAGCVVAALTAVPATPAHAAPGCYAGRPTALTGAIYGYGGSYNNWSVQVLIGIDLSNAQGKKVRPDGTLMVDSNGNNLPIYSHIDYVNPDLGQPGAPSGFDRTWGENGTTSPLCVSSVVTEVFLEVAPKDNSSGSWVTDKTYYGYAVDQHQPVVAEATNTFNLRIPTGDPYGGNTGDINGYITYQGHKVNPDYIDPIRVWPKQLGSACGVQGGSQGADDLGYSGSLDATYYNIRFLAAGQCGGANQAYRLQVTCVTVCGGTKITKTFDPVYVVDGARPRIDVAF